MLRVVFLLLLGAICAACTQLPALDDTVAQDVRKGKYPKLVPFDQLTAHLPQPHETEDAVASRSTALKTRASALQSDVVDQTTRSRMETGVQAR